MPFALDHLFVCTAPDAPEADVLTDARFTEGPRNVHPGEGTACRRCFFRNAYLELCWVHNETEARSPATAPTRLWERWHGRADGHTCPFGVGLRAADGAGAPFPTWPYRPRYVPPGTVVRVATNGELLHEPMLFLTPGSPPPRGAATATGADTAGAPARPRDRRPGAHPRDAGRARDGAERAAHGRRRGAARGARGRGRACPPRVRR